MFDRALKVAHGALAHLSFAKSQNLKLLAVAATAVLWPGVALPQTAAGFATEAAAQGWIAQDQRLRTAADPFGTPAGRRRRGY